MKRRMCYAYILMASLLLLSLVCAVSKPWLLFGAGNQQALFQHSVPTTRIQDVSRHAAFVPTQGSERILRGLSRLGSAPPRCEHKCGGCIPCNPIQIPTNKDLLGVQYANYEPEGWKCKCGSSYFNP